MDQSRAQTLGGAFFEISEHAIHAPDVDTGVASRNSRGPLPTLFIRDQPVALPGR
jgi:hypothetical protein